MIIRKFIESQSKITWVDNNGIVITIERAQDPTASPLSTHSSSASPHHGQKGDHREESPEILVGIGSGGNNNVTKDS